MAKSRAKYMREYRARKKREHKIEDYGKNPQVPTINKPDDFDVAHVTPITIDTLAGGVADFPDQVYEADLTHNAHLLSASCPSVMKSMAHAEALVTRLDWVVIGEGERAEQLQEIIDQSYCWESMVSWLLWAILEGVRFQYIKPHQTTKWVVPDFQGGGRKKQKAGGTVQWDGTRLMQVQQLGHESRDAEEIPLQNDQWIIHRPGAGSNPEGDLALGLSVYLLAKSWIDAAKNIDSYFSLYGLPARILQKKIDNAQYDAARAMMIDAANSLAQKGDYAASAARARQRDQIVITNEDTLSLLEPRGKGIDDMTSYQRYIDGMIDQLIVLNQLTKSTTDAGPVGSSRVASEQQDASTFKAVIQIAESLNRYLIPWIDRNNPDLAELGEDEVEPYIWPMPYGHRQQDNQIDDESLLVDEVSQDAEDAPEVVAPDPDPDDANLETEE